MNLEEFFNELFTDEFYSGYKLANTLSNAIGKRVREQMIYGYTAKGWIATVVIGNKKFIEREECIRWSVKYTSKNAPEFAKELLSN